MHVITRKKLIPPALVHAQAKDALNAWYKIANKANWQNLNQVQEVYPHADVVGPFTVFNIKGNDFRLITGINYRSQTIYIKHVLTHAEYSKAKWKS